MRRKDREITDQNEINEIIGRCQVLNLGLNTEDYPYVLPVNFAFKASEDKRVFYFHSAQEGRKIELIKKDDRCGFTLYNDLGVKTVREGEQATNYYECVMGSGIIKEITDKEEKRKVAYELLKKYGYEGEIQFDDRVLERTYLAKIEVLSISGKANREVIK